MADYGYTETEKLIKKLEERIRSAYSEAASEMAVTIREFQRTLAREEERLQGLLDAGEITEDYFEDWKLAATVRSKRFQDLADAIANRLVKCQETANAYINESLAEIYALNRNYENYDIVTKGADFDFGFSLNGTGGADRLLWDEAVVKRLIVEKPDLMPHYPIIRAIDRGINLAWGKTQITNIVTAGIIQGQSITQITDKMLLKIFGNDLVAARRAARTACTNAQNGGRQDTLEEVEKQGIETLKEWVATLDKNTRTSHQEADGKRVKPNEPFHLPGGDLMFPGDGSLGAGGEELYNCRCCMVSYLPEYAFAMPDREKYPEWKRRMEEEEGQL